MGDIGDPADEGLVELFVFARFHVREGAGREAEAALRDTLLGSREEPGCPRIHAFRSIRDPRLYYIHSLWKDEAAFDLHATLPHTVRFLERMDRLIDQPRDVTRAEQMR